MAAGAAGRFKITIRANRSRPMSVLVNDVHAKLNETRVEVVRTPVTLAELREIVQRAAHAGRPLAVCGARHAMGGQQFLDDAVLLDTRALDRILHLDVERGVVTVESGCTWPRLIRHYEAEQSERLGVVRWGIAQKQTGADDLTIGGAIAANAHGRGLRMKPLVGDVIALAVVDPTGEVLNCSRAENVALFQRVVGGYGLFGIIYSATLQLAPRRVLRRVVRVIDIEDAASAGRRRIAEGHLYGDFQFDIDPRSPDFLTKGVFSSYVPVEGNPAIPANQRVLEPAQWDELLYLAHVDKRRAFQLYAAHYLGTDGQLYHSDTHQLSTYLDDYHAKLDARTGAAVRGSEMIAELYVPHDGVIAFLRRAARRLIDRGVSVIYGTIRLIARDDETFLPWARQDCACVVFNLHVDHSPEGIARAATAFRALIDEALALGGSFFLTYHRFATRDQLLRAYPELPAFIAEKRRLDPQGRFQSNWFRWLVETLQP
jgi:FAD/FMN-containing dehydrogenase